LQVSTFNVFLFLHFRNPIKETNKSIKNAKVISRDKDTDHDQIIKNFSIFKEKRMSLNCILKFLTPSNGLMIYLKISPRYNPMDENFLNFFNRTSIVIFIIFLLFLGLEISSCIWLTANLGRESLLVHKRFPSYVQEMPMQDYFLE
jgi:hypothetical protein